MTKKIFFLLTAIVAHSQLYAQHTHEAMSRCIASKLKTHHHTAAKPTVAHPAEDNYDVKHLAFDISMTDTSTYLEGNVKTTAQVLSSALSDYVFELNPVLTIDSATINGTLLPVVTSGFVRTIHLPIPVSAGSFFIAQVYYHGSPPASGPLGEGMTHDISTGGTHVVWTSSEPYEAAFWWPAKQSLSDKIDSVDMRVKVPAAVVNGSNGLLTGVDNISSPGYSIYQWKTRYPIDYYLVSVTAARYEQLTGYMHFTGSTDSMLIQHFVMDTATFMPVSRVDLDSIPGMINFFSSLFGRYPFWKEKYGIATAYIGGGMENQTLSTQYDATPYLSAHELVHQWFGDNVTQKTWSDIWLSEGFASFGTTLYVGYRNGAVAERAERVNTINNGITYGGACGRISVTDTTSSDSLFTSNQYQKAEAVLNTLRFLAPHDSLFFKVLKVYQQTYAQRNAGTMEFKAITESVYGFSLDTFFNQWIYGRGYPVYSATWNQEGSTVYLKLVQTQSCPSYTSHFSTPLEVRFRSGTIDTFITVYNSLNTQTYVINWDRPMSGVFLNWNAQVFMKTLVVAKDNSLTGIVDIQGNQAKISPNPTYNNWEVGTLPEATQLVLMDLTGKVIWQQTSGKGNTIVPGAQLPSGTYLLRLTNTQTQTIKVVKW